EKEGWCARYGGVLINGLLPVETELIGVPDVEESKSSKLDL
ncbi:5089_t:CDS:1, partial [Paraglomus brasilianum]